jgi:hypothetical protein
MIGARLVAMSGGLSAFCLGLALLTYVIPNFVPEPSFSMGDAPGPQAFPRVLAWGFILLGGMDAIAVCLSRETQIWRKPEAIGRLALVSAILIASLLAMPYLGMLPVGIVLMITITTLASGQKMVPSLLTAVLFAAAVYLIFVLVAGIPLPMGEFWD